MTIFGTPDSAEVGLELFFRQRIDNFYSFMSVDLRYGIIVKNIR
tara:strand:+ start:1539 stop:1670 length:132 start_codon:yes stop_codon:yes gene_type:complete